MTRRYLGQPPTLASPRLAAVETKQTVDDFATAGALVGNTA
ncbi:MAG: hypothetical protein JWL88_49 [Parcubacteria group bacterium]|nr:hypothetical protein [Parcubacteria group bacterium]